MRRLLVEGPESLEDFLKMYKAEKHPKRKKWLHIIILVLEDHNAVQIANIFKMSQEAVRRVVRNYNKYGIEALVPKTSPGRPNALTPEQMNQLQQFLENGPTHEDKVNKWTGKIVQKLILREFGNQLGLSTVYSLLHQLGYSWLCPRPKNPKQEEKEKQQFKKNSAPDQTISSPKSYDSD